MQKRIFIIDDDNDLLEILNFFFQEGGYHVLTANHTEAIDLVPDYKPNLVILDVNIAGSPKSGPQLCEELKADETMYNIPVMLLSSDPDLPQTAALCGADLYMDKPFDADKLLNKVKQAVA